MSETQLTVMWVTPKSVLINSGSTCRVGIKSSRPPFEKTDRDAHVFEVDGETCRCGRMTVRRHD